MKIALVFLLIFGAVPWALPGDVSAPVTARQIGIYDSRVLAYAHFWSEPVGKQRDELVARAKSAKALGEVAVLKDLERRIEADQKHIHLQVFSAAPADEAMAALAPKLPALCQELGVAKLVSKWDAAALKGIPESDQVDVTDRLAREIFTPTEKQRKTIESIKAAKPLPLPR